jgi:hypothetical protein
VAPIITGVIVHFRFHIRCISIHKPLYFKFFSASLLLLLLLLLLLYYPEDRSSSFRRKVGVYIPMYCT